VAKIAMGYRGYGLPIGEVISEGNVGLMQAVKKFDPDKGFRLATYAMWWIRASIQEYILRSWSLVKMGTTAAQKKLFFNLRKAKSEIAALQEGDLRPDQVSLIATKLGVLDEEVDLHEPPPRRRRRQPERADARRRRERVAGLAGRRRHAQPGDGDRRHAGEEPAHEPARRGDDRTHRPRAPHPDRAAAEGRADDAGGAGREYGVSRERVRQIEVRAFEKLQKSMRAAALEKRLVEA
jgi:RNA polymerase sigma-32 factor